MRQQHLFHSCWKEEACYDCFAFLSTLHLHFICRPIYGNQQQMITTRPRFGAVQADRPYYQPTAHFALGSFVVPNSITRPLVSIMLPYKSHPNWINIAQQGTYFGCNCQRCSYYARYLCPRINSGTAIKNFTQYHPLRLVDSQLGN